MQLRDFFIRVIDIFDKDVFMEIYAKNSTKKVVYARCIVAYYLGAKMCYKYREIAEYLNQSRSTIAAYFKKYHNWYRHNKEFRNFADKVLKE